MKKKIIIIAIVVILLVLLVPIKSVLKDGGTVEYNAVLYSVIKRNAMWDEEGVSGSLVGTEIRVLFFVIYDDVEFVPDHEVEE